MAVCLTCRGPEACLMQIQDASCQSDQSMDATTAGDHLSRCRHCLQLRLPLPLSLIPFYSSGSQLIGNDREGFWIRDGGRQVFKRAERSGSTSNAGCRAGYNVIRWVCLCDSAGRWCVTTACSRCGSWSIYWPSLCCGRSENHALSDIYNMRIVQRTWGGGVLTLDCRGYGTPSLRRIRLATRYRNASLSMRMLRHPWRPMLVLILTICETSNISYDWTRDLVSAVGRHHPIWMLDHKTERITSSAFICNGRRGRLLFERTGRNFTNKGDAVLTALDSTRWQYPQSRSLQNHSIMRSIATRLNSDSTQHWFSLWQQSLKVYLHRLKGVYAFLAWLSSYCTHFWHNTLNHRLYISSASRWKSPFGSAKIIPKWSMTCSLSYNISCVCFLHRYAFVAVFDGCTVGTTWKQLSLPRDAGGLSGKGGMRCQKNARWCKLSSPRVRNLVSRLVIHGNPGGAGCWLVCRFVFVNQQNPEDNRWTTKSLVLEDIYPFFQPTPPLPFAAILNTQPVTALECMEVLGVKRYEEWKGVKEIVLWKDGDLGRHRGSGKMVAV